MIKKRTIYEMYILSHTLTDEEYIEQLQKYTGLSKHILKKHDVAKKLRENGAVYNPDIGDTLIELNGKNIKITIEEV